MDREEALKLVRKYTSNENLVKHMLAVEAAMRFYAEKEGANVEKWGVCGLVHDFDYEKMGEEHPSEWGYKVLREHGADEDIIVAIIGHADGGKPYSRPSRMAKALFAVDELTGFIVACALPRPNQISDLSVKSVKKKLKDKSFASGVDREHIRNGAEEFGVELDQHIENVITAMRSIKSELGLK
jgi:predicted hydrolase (HD superfamily)